MGVHGSDTGSNGRPLDTFIRPQIRGERSKKFSLFLHDTLLQRYGISIPGSTNRRSALVMNMLTHNNIMMNGWLETRISVPDRL